MLRIGILILVFNNVLAVRGRKPMEYFKISNFNKSSMAV